MLQQKVQAVEVELQKKEEEKQAAEQALQQAEAKAKTNKVWEVCVPALREQMQTCVASAWNSGPHLPHF